MRRFWIARYAPLPPTPSRSFRVVMPDFWLGSARLFDLAGNLNNFVLFRDKGDTAEQVDGKALASDWAAVEEQLAAALTQLGAARVTVVDADVPAAPIPVTLDAR